MTREEAKDVFLNRGFIEIEGCRGRIFNADKWREACVVISEWLTSLEQEPVLDKIRTEIENHCGLTKENHCRYCSYCNSVMGVREILEIIDKYKADSEGKK